MSALEPFAEKLTTVKTVGDGSTFDKAAFTAYENVKAERDALKESEAVYRRKVVSLEQDAENLLKSYQDIYEENKVLRSKLEHGPDALKIKKIRNEIKKQKEKLESIHSENGLLKEEIYRLQKQLGQTTEDKQRVNDAFKIERELHVDKVTDLVKENGTLEEKVDKYETKLKEYEFRIQSFENESEGLINRYKNLKHDNIKLETKFKKQKDLLEETVRDEQHSNKEMSKEIIHLKTKLAKLLSDNQSLDLDNKTLQKQKEYQNRELEVLKTQTSVLKRNLKLTSQENQTLKDDLRSTEGMLDDAKRFGFDAVYEEKKAMTRKKRMHLKRMNDMEEGIEELSRENKTLQDEAETCRKKMETAIMDREAFSFKIKTLKQRIEVLENANIELDRKTLFQHDKHKKALAATFGDDKARELIKENKTLLAKVQDLKVQNRRLSQKLYQHSEKGIPDEFEDNVTVISFRRSRKRQNRIIKADMPSLNRTDYNISYNRTVNTSKSLPAKSLKEYK